MKTEIFICTCSKDFPWLKYCLRSIKKFATGFFAVTILVPHPDLPALVDLVDKTRIEDVIPVYCLGGDEWPGLGMLWHEAQIMYADQCCPSADFIAHIDPDCVFTAPVTPETYIKNGKPILCYERFSNIVLRHPGIATWQNCTTNCLPFPVVYETMRHHPEVYHRGLYAIARRQMWKKTGQYVKDYIRSCRNEFPQTFCEFVTLGNVAMHLFPELYELVEQFSDRITPPKHLQAFWSHGPMYEVQNIWVDGEFKPVVPLEMLTKLGLHNL